LTTKGAPSTGLRIFFLSRSDLGCDLKLTFQLDAGAAWLEISHILATTVVDSQISAHPAKNIANHLGAFASASITPLSESRKPDAEPFVRWGLPCLVVLISFQSATSTVNNARPSETTMNSQPRLNRLSM
jgi:hypothetical protein